MTIRLAGLAALALLSCACSFRSPATAPQPVEPSDGVAYNEPWAPSPNYRGAVVESASVEAEIVEAPSAEHAQSGHLLGSPAVTPTHSVKADDAQLSSRDACHDAAVKSGMKTGACTLLSERKYVLLGEK